MLATSCSMDLEPVGAIIAEDAIESIDDIVAFRNGFYNNVRALSTGGYVYYTEIQMDNFLGTVTNGNRLGSLNNGVILSNDSDIESIWAGLYGAIANVNFFLEHTDDLIKNGGIAEDEMVYVDRYIAEGKFIRGYYYYWLMDHYCPAYTAATKDTNLGLPIVTKYNPTADKSSYPGRATLEETYTFIENDLTDALNGMLEYEKYVTTSGTREEKEELSSQMMCPMAPYICSWTVKAMQARLALLKGDYRTAYNLSVDVINNGNYTLSDRVDYEKMWTNDTSNEIIFRPISTNTELGINSTGSAWIGTSEFQADYMPVPYVALPGSNSNVNLYRERDVRYTTFISTRRLLSDGRFVEIPVFVKYPGNPALIQSNENLMNMPKPFRLSELYLIAAESACELNKPVEANNYLQDIRLNRISRYSRPENDFSGDALRAEIRIERLRELIGEGFRMSDLRRWREGFNRTDINYVGTSASYPNAPEVIVAAGVDVVYTDDDHRYVWPIPSSELQVNPQIASQQNPGY